MCVSHIASAVNFVQVTGSATTANPTLSAQGSDSNIGLSFASKGSFGMQFNNSSGGAIVQYTQSGTTSATTNFFRLTNVNGTGSAPILSSQGNDTNISMAFQPKGTGAINLAAGSSGVNVSNGGTVTAITRTNSGTNYTSIPSLVISAPTTAGGVQATATPQLSVSGGGFTIASGGTGYIVGNTLSVVGGTASQVATFTVATVSAGVITGLTLVTSGSYSVLPSNPISLSGGSGSVIGPLLVSEMLSKKINSASLKLKFVF
jgi:hypothetical protein